LLTTPEKEKPGLPGVYCSITAYLFNRDMVDYNANVHTKENLLAVRFAEKLGLSNFDGSQLHHFYYELDFLN